MRRIATATLAIVLFAGSAFVTTGCASSQGPYFQRTRANKSHTFRNRIHNPNDNRYVEAPEAPRGE